LAENGFETVQRVEKGAEIEEKYEKEVCGLHRHSLFSVARYLCEKGIRQYDPTESRRVPGVIAFLSFV